MGADRTVPGVLLDVLASDPGCPAPVRQHLAAQAATCARRVAVASNPALPLAEFTTLLTTASIRDLPDITAAMPALTPGHLRAVVDAYTRIRPPTGGVSLRALLGQVADPEDVLVEFVATTSTDLLTLCGALAHARTPGGGLTAATAVARSLLGKDMRDAKHTSPLRPARRMVNRYGRPVADAVWALRWWAATHPHQWDQVAAAAPGGLLPRRRRRRWRAPERGAWQHLGDPDTDPGQVIAWADQATPGSWEALAAHHPDPTGVLMTAALDRCVANPTGLDSTLVTLAVADRTLPTAPEVRERAVMHLVRYHDAYGATTRARQLMGPGSVAFVEHTLAYSDDVEVLRALFGRDDLPTGVLDAALTITEESSWPMAVCAVWVATHPTARESTRARALGLLRQLDPELVPVAAAGVQARSDPVAAGRSLPVPVLRSLPDLAGVREMVRAAYRPLLPHLGPQHLVAVQAMEDGDFLGTVGELLDTAVTVTT